MPTCLYYTYTILVGLLSVINPDVVPSSIGVNDDVMRRLVNHLLTLLETATIHSLNDLQLCKVSYHVTCT